MKANKTYDYDAVADFIVSYFDKNKRSPSIRDIKEGCDVSSTSVVNYILQALDEEGKIVFRRDGTARNILPIEVARTLGVVK